MVRRILWLEPFWVLLLGVAITLPGRMVPLDWHPYLVAALLLFWPLAWLVYRSFVPSTPLNWSVLGILFWLPVNVWASADRATSWIAAGYLVFGIALFVAVVRWPPARRRPALAAGMLLLFGGGLALASPPLVEWKPQFRLFRLPLYDQLQNVPLDLGETIHANVLAGVLVIVLPFFAALTLRSSWTERRWPRLACGGATLLVIGVLVLTQSRGGYLAAAAALGIVLLLRWPRLLYAVPLGLLLIGFFIWRTGFTLILDQLSQDGALGGWTGRLDIWTHSATAIMDFVFTGIGIGTFTLVIPLLYPLQVNIEGYPHAHNLYLQIGVDLGLPGLIAYLALLLNLFVMLAIILRRGTNALAWALAAGALAGLTAMLLHGLLDAVLWGTKVAFVPWLLFALVALLYEAQFPASIPQSRALTPSGDGAE